MKEGYDSDDEYGDDGSAHTKYEAKKSKSAAKNYERERAQVVADSKRNSKQITNVLESPATAKHLIIALVRVKLIGHARNNMYVNISHAWL